MATQYPKYTFDLDFSQPLPRTKRGEVGRPATTQPVPEEPPPPPPPPPPPTFSEEELQMARETAFTEGVDAGRTAVLRSTEQALANALTVVATQVTGLFQAQRQAAAQAQRESIQVAMAVLHKMLPAACERHGLDEVVSVVSDMVKMILDEPRVIVRLAPTQVEEARERLTAACAHQGFEGRLLVEPDEHFSPGDCRVEWAHGGAIREQAQLMAEIDDAVARALASPLGQEEKENRDGTMGEVDKLAEV